MGRRDQSKQPHAHCRQDIQRELLYVKIDLFNLRPLDPRINFPLPPGIPHATIAGRMRVPLWQDLWRLKHRMMTYMSPRTISLGLITYMGATAFPVLPHTEFYSLVITLRCLIASAHRSLPGEDEAKDLGEDVGIWLPHPHITFYTIVESGW